MTKAKKKKKTAKNFFITQNMLFINQKSEKNELFRYFIRFNLEQIPVTTTPPPHSPCGAFIHSSAFIGI